MKLLISMIGLGTGSPPTYEPVQVVVPWAAHAQAAGLEAYHQHALIRALAPDAVWLVGTAEAKAAHAAAIRHDRFIQVPKCETDLEFWQMFGQIAAELESLPDSKVIHELHVDLTHGFRVQPMFLLSAVRYAATLHTERLAVAGIYYSLLSEDRKIATLRQVDSILDMERVAEDVRALAAYSQPGPLADRLTRIERQRRMAFMASGGKSAEMPPLFSALRHLAEKLDIFGTVVGVNCTPVAASVVRDLCHFATETADELDGDLRPVAMALRQLRDELSAQLPGPNEPLWRWHAALALWCRKRGLLQQALTHAEELVVTRACEEADINPLDRNARQPIAESLKALGRGGSNGAVPAAWRRIIDAWQQITTFRNDVNHAYTGRGATALQAKRAGKDMRDAVEKLVIANLAIDALPPLPKWR